MNIKKLEDHPGVESVEIRTVICITTKLKKGAVRAEIYKEEREIMMAYPDTLFDFKVIR